MTGCNEEQKKVWRRRVISKWGDEFGFIDPTEQLMSPEEVSREAIYEIIRREEGAI